LLAVVSGLVDLISLRGGVDVGGALTVIGCVFTVAVSTFGGWSGVLLQVLVAWSLPHFTHFGWCFQLADKCP